MTWPQIKMMHCPALHITGPRGMGGGKRSPKKFVSNLSIRTQSSRKTFFGDGKGGGREKIARGGKGINFRGTKLCEHVKPATKSAETSSGSEATSMLRADLNTVQMSPVFSSGETQYRT